MKWSSAGFQLAIILRDSPAALHYASSGPVVFVVIPYWALSLAFAIPPMQWVLYARHQRRRRQRLAGGLCAYCGYDLRATTRQCPECGNLPYVAPRPLLRRIVRFAAYSCARPAWRRGKPLMVRSILFGCIALFSILCAAAALAGLRSYCRTDAIGWRSSELVTATWLNTWFETRVASVTLEPDLVVVRSQRGRFEYFHYCSHADPTYTKRLRYAAAAHEVRQETIRGSNLPAMAPGPPTHTRPLDQRSWKFLGASWSRAEWRETVPLFDPSVPGTTVAPTSATDTTSMVQSFGISYATVACIAALLLTSVLMARRHRRRGLGADPMAR